MTEWDIVHKEETEQPPVVVEEEPPKKKKKKKKEEEVKLYPHHKYQFAAVGKNAKRDGTDSCFGMEPDL